MELRKWLKERAAKPSEYLNLTYNNSDDGDYPKYVYWYLPQSPEEEKEKERLKQSRIKRERDNRLQRRQGKKERGAYDWENAIFLSQLINNDSTIDALEVYWNWSSSCNRLDWKAYKNAIGENTHLKKLKIDMERKSVCNMNNFQEFCKGLAANRSLNFVEIHNTYINTDICTSLGSHICSLEFENCTIRGKDGTADALTSLISRKDSSLTCLIFRYCNISDRSTAIIISALNNHPNLTILGVLKQQTSSLGHKSWKALGKILPNSKISELDIQCHHSNANIDDTSAIMLGDGLFGNSTLKSLTMTGCTSIGATGYLSIFSVLQSPSCAIENLVLGEALYSGDKVAVLANALANNTSLKVLNLHRLCKNRREGLTVEIARWLGRALASHRRLKSLDLDETGLKSKEWRAFFSSFQNLSFNFEVFDLSRNNIDDKCIHIFSDALATNKTLRTLDLNRNSSVSSTGWQVLSGVLHTNYGLTTLDFGRNGDSDDDRINNDVLLSLANALANNNTLQSLGLLSCDCNDQTESGLVALSRMLYDKSSLESTISSNHTLSLIDVSSYGGEWTRHSDLFTSLEWNRNVNKHEVIQRKVINHHFLNNADGIVQAFLGVDLEVVPHVLALLGKDRRGMGVLAIQAFEEDANSS